MYTITVTSEEYNAVIAGLRLLQNALENSTVRPDDGDIGDILTNTGSEQPLTIAQINELVERIA